MQSVPSHWSLSIQENWGGISIGEFRCLRYEGYAEHVISSWKFLSYVSFTLILGGFGFQFFRRGNSCVKRTLFSRPLSVCSSKIYKKNISSPESLKNDFTEGDIFSSKEKIWKTMGDFFFLVSSSYQRLLAGFTTLLFCNFNVYRHHTQALQDHI